MKKYLASPPLLVKPLSGEELQLYLAVSETATSGALVKVCNDKIQRPIYYVGEKLQLYLAVSETATSWALVKGCSDGIQRPVYYVSCALTKSEKNYTLMEKLAYAPVTTARNSGRISKLIPLQ